MTAAKASCTEVTAKMNLSSDGERILFVIDSYQYCFM